MPTAALLVVFRWWYFLGLGAVVALAFGGNDLVVALGSPATPRAVDPAAIERDGAPAERWLRIGEHVALLDLAVVFRHQEEERRRAATPPDVDHVLYPIASLHHPYVEAWRALDAQYGSRADVPLGKVPRPDDLRVFVRAAALPPNPGRSPLLHRDHLIALARPWTLVNAKVDERTALLASMPGIDPERVVILDANLSPPSLGDAIAVLALGVLLSILAVRRFRRGLRAPSQPPPPRPTRARARARQR
jgi:hypothetical protein